jgi:hypothetical protein
MPNDTATQLPALHSEMIDAIRPYIENSPDSLREHLDKALADYIESGAWQADDLSAYE